MRVGLAAIYSLRQGATWRESMEHLLWQARFGDVNGYENMWLTEHHFTEWGATGNTSVWLAHLAAQTKRLRLGYSVALLPFHHPVRLAEEMLLIDQMSNGRLDIGVGRGHAHIETAVLCPDPERSVELFDDAFAIIQAAFTGQSFTFRGAYWSFPEITIYPPPYRERPPIYMVMTSPRSIAFAAEHRCVPIVGNRDRAFLKAQIAEYAATARARNVPDEAIQFALDRVSASRYVAFAESRQQAREMALQDLAYFDWALKVYQSPLDDPLPRTLQPVPPRDLTDDEIEARAVWGTRDDVIDQLRALEAVGVRQLSISLDSPVLPVAEGRRRLLQFTEKVLPALTATSSPAPR
ncbi:MAG: LLM class flavin-dependent oxidoreductase [Dehalococcoidia bacterium]|nr:LLM class flavin-dependent oxidoreductase [Dehalococcoidia bacterium]